jgi:hypothetical protein
MQYIKIRKGLIICVLLNILLVLIGLLLVPTALTASKNGISGLIAVISILLVYFGISYYGTITTERFDKKILHYSLIFGVFIGFLFFIEIILEYILLPDSLLNVKMGYAEFGVAFCLYFFSGLWSILKTQKYLSSVLTSFWTALIASLIWLTSVLLIYYLFYGTSQQMTVLKAEGNFEDFKQSGMIDFNAFIVQDFWGAGFFHLFLGPLVASFLGALGGLMGLLFLKLFKSK